MNSAHQGPQTRDFKDLTKDALHHSCTHADITEIHSGISKLNLCGVQLMISTKVDEIFSFWRVTGILLNKFRKSSRQIFEKDALRHNCTHGVLSEILRGISKWNFHGILFTISCKVDEIYLFWKETWILLINIVRHPTSEIWKMMDNVIIVHLTSYLKSSPAYLS